MSEWSTRKEVVDAFVPVGHHMVRLSLIESFRERDEGAAYSNGKRVKSVVVRASTGTEYVAQRTDIARFTEVLRTAYSPTT